MKGYWIKFDEEGNTLECFQGWSDEEHEGYQFYTETEYFEIVKGKSFCPIAGGYYMDDKCKDNPCSIYCPFREDI